MTVLVVSASRHGSTREVAQRLAVRLRERGLTVDEQPCAEPAAIERYEAVVIGSAVYSGAWLPAARDFLRNHAEALAHRPTWTFTVGGLTDQSGVLGRVSWPDAAALPALQQRIGARGHRFFPGALGREGLPLLQRAVFGLLGGRYGDFRDWAEVDAFADTIADRLVDGGPAVRSEGDGRASHPAQRLGREAKKTAPRAGHRTERGQR